MNIAYNFAKDYLKESSTILLDAEMGAGKTTFAQGLSRGLGVTDIVNSPTFNILKMYKGDKFTFYHLDCYRLEGIEDASSNGIEFRDYIDDPLGIIYIEWYEYLYSDLKYINNKLYKIVITILSEDSRRIEIYEE